MTHLQCSTAANEKGAPLKRYPRPNAGTNIVLDTSEATMKTLMTTGIDLAEVVTLIESTESTRESKPGYARYPLPHTCSKFQQQSCYVLSKIYIHHQVAFTTRGTRQKPRSIDDKLGYFILNLWVRKTQTTLLRQIMNRFQHTDFAHPPVNYRIPILCFGMGCYLIYESLCEMQTETACVWHLLNSKS